MELITSKAVKKKELRKSNQQSKDRKRTREKTAFGRKMSEVKLNISVIIRKVNK